MNFVRMFVVFVVPALVVGCVPPESEDDVLEKSRPAIEMAAEYEDLDAPVAFGFEAPKLTANTPDAAGFPRWYCPKSVVTRGQMASFVARTVNGPDAPLPVYDGSFGDVTVNNRHAGAVAFVSERGISTGCADGAFCPDDGVTRAQMALFTVRMMHGPDFILPTPTTSRYLDVPTSHKHAGAIEQLAIDGIELTCGDGAFCPDRPVSRDEMAAFLVPAKYRNSPPGPAASVFADVAPQNPHRAAVDVLVRDGITVGCEAPQAGYRLNGEPLTPRMRDWLLYFAGRTLPRLAAVYDDTARAFTIGARVVWWSLKEGVFGMFDDPFQHALCNGGYIGPFDGCDGSWEVGLTAAIVPGDAEVRAAASALYPQQSLGELALANLEFGRALSQTFDAGEYPSYAQDWVMTDPALQRSWLARDAAIGAYLMIDDIERDCIDGAAEHCFGLETESSRDFAPNAETAEIVMGDIRRILVALRPR